MIKILDGEDVMDNHESYPLPVIFHSGYKPAMHVLFIFIICIFAALYFLPVHDTGGILFRILSAMFSFFIFTCWLYVGVLKKDYIRITEEEVSFKATFSFEKSIYFRDVAKIAAAKRGRNSFIGLVSREKVKKQKESASLKSLFIGKYSLQIMLGPFSQVDFDLLYNTLVAAVKAYQLKYPEEMKSLEP